MRSSYDAHGAMHAPGVCTSRDAAAPLRLPGRAIKAKLEPEQLKLIKELKGIPMVDK